jgi:pyruvate formate lyase activating enzyme
LQGIIFDIQTYSIYDGPGIRTTVFFKGCPLRCSWCQNPESQKLTPEIAYFRERCKQCGGCVQACPEQALRLTAEGVRRDEALCSRCGSCAEACPDGVMEIIGRRVSAEEVVETVETDRAFFESSGGGVTISGGEAALQADFLTELLDQFRARDIHTALETCGFFSRARLDQLCCRVELILLDIKHPDTVAHENGTGVGNERIFRNFSLLVRHPGPHRVLLRIPLIPGFNTDEKTVQGILDFARKAGYDGPVHLMPYNTMIRTKYEKIGRQMDFMERAPQSEEDLDRILHQVKKSGFEAVCNR